MPFFKKIVNFGDRKKPFNMLRLSPNVVWKLCNRWTILSMKFSYLPCIVLELVAAEVQKMIFSGIFFRFEVEFDAVRHLRFAPNFPGRWYHLLSRCCSNFNFLGPLRGEICGLEVHNWNFLAKNIYFGPNLT